MLGAGHLRSAECMVRYKFIFTAEHSLCHFPLLKQEKSLIFKRLATHGNREVRLYENPIAISFLKN
jgi:hypothetical protein